MSSRTSLMVAAIDFGTTFSGYAFSTKAEFESNALNIHANLQWKPGTLSMKCPSCILFNENKQFQSFGYDAEDDYANVVLDKRQNEFYYFKHFKMALYHQKDSYDNFLVEDVAGKSLPAKDVFSNALKAIKDHFISELKRRGSLGSALKEDEISWVLTVPSIWTESAKKFMRECAEKTNIGKKLSIALEPESASIFCQYQYNNEKKTSLITTGSKFMVVDIGGGTTDIVVKEVLPDGKLNDLCNPSGDNCGGTTFDNEFLAIFIQIMGGDLMGRFKTEYPMEYLDLWRTAECLKQRNIGGKPIRTAVPIVAFDKLCNEKLKNNFLTVLKSSKFKNSITHVTGDRLQFTDDIFSSLFTSATNKIVQLIKHNFTKPECAKVSMVLLVGGFSESPLVQDAVRKIFPDKNIIIPTEGTYAVLKGAVIYGHKPDIIASRIVKYSYGISSTETYDPSCHDKNKVVEIDGVKRCQDLFRILINANTSVVEGERRSYNFHTTYKYQEFATLRVFYSPTSNPKYVDEPDCKKLGELEIKIQNPSKHRIEIDVEFQFGLTELVVSAKQRGTQGESNITFKYS